MDFHPAVEWQWLRHAGQDALAYPLARDNTFIFSTSQHPASEKHLPQEPEMKDFTAEIYFNVATFNPGSLKDKVTKAKKNKKALARKDLFVAQALINKWVIIGVQEARNPKNAKKNKGYLIYSSGGTGPKYKNHGVELWISTSIPYGTKGGKKNYFWAPSVAWLYTPRPDYSWRRSQDPLFK